MTARTILVCPLSKLSKTLDQSGAKRVISLLSIDTQFERPKNIAQDDHLILRFNDITEPRDGLVAPSEMHILSLIEFAAGWDWSTPLLVHCWAGISRSPAAAAIIALALDASRDDKALAVKLRDLSGSITPNIMMIDIADRMLHRDGQFSKAVRSIGRGEEAFEGNAFRLQV